MFIDPANVAKKQVPGNRALRFERGYRVGVDKAVGHLCRTNLDSELKQIFQPDEAISVIVDDIIGITDPSHRAYQAVCSFKVG
jgi:hypothetical protein